MRATDELSQIISSYAKTGQPFRWTVPNGLASSVGIQYRNNSVEKTEKLSLRQAARLNGSLCPEDMAELFDLATRHVLGEPLRGIGIELGGGLGTLSAAVAKSASVETIFCVDVCENFVTRMMPRVAEYTLGERACKVIPVVGSFDNLELPAESLDFAVEIRSLHHSDDLARTAKECARVLKYGGHSLFFDRVHPDTVTDEEVDRMLSRVYSRDWLIRNGYPPDAKLTRRANGEHEYRRAEWEAAFKAAGLTLIETVEFHEIISWRTGVKGLCSVLPAWLQRRLFRTPGSFGDFLAYAAKKLHLPISKIGRIVFAPQRNTVFLLRKG